MLTFADIRWVKVIGEGVFGEEVFGEGVFVEAIMSDTGSLELETGQ